MCKFISQIYCPCVCLTPKTLNVMAKGVKYTLWFFSGAGTTGLNFLISLGN